MQQVRSACLDSALQLSRGGLAAAAQSAAEPLQHLQKAASAQRLAGPVGSPRRIGRQHGCSGEQDRQAAARGQQVRLAHGAVAQLRSLRRAQKRLPPLMTCLSIARFMRYVHAAAHEPGIVDSMLNVPQGGVCPEPAVQHHVGGDV